MRKSTILFMFLVTLTFFMCVQSASAGPTLITEQSWSFSSADNPADADTGYINPGIPTATIIATSGEHVPDAGWKEFNWLGHDGVWAGDTVDIVLDIPNYVNSNPYKIIFLEATFFGDLTNYIAEILDPASGVTNLGVEILPIGDGWNTLSASWEIIPNPDFEKIHLYFVNSGAAVDDVYVWTECVPEPATICLLGLGGLVLRKRRKIS
jgi:hypothetical protein